MKRRITLSIALLLSVISLSLMSSDSTATAQQRSTKSTADTGVVTLGPNQVLRVTAAVDGADFLAVRFRRIQYAQTTCNDGVCQLGSVTDLVIDPFTLMPGQAASIDITQGGFAGVRGVVHSSRRNVRVTAGIIDTVTGETVSHIIIANTEGDVH